MEGWAGGVAAAPRASLPRREFIAALYVGGHGARGGAGTQGI